MLLFPLFSPQACEIESRSCSTPWLCPLPAVWLEGVTETLQSQAVCVSRSIVSNSLGPPWTVACQAPSVLGDSRGKNSGVGCHVLFQGIFPTQVSNPNLLHCRQILYHLSHEGNSPYEKNLPHFHLIPTPVFRKNKWILSFLP